MSIETPRNEPEEIKSIETEEPKYSPEVRQNFGSQRGGEVSRALKADELKKTESGQYLASEKYIEKAKSEMEGVSEMSPEYFAVMVGELSGLKETLLQEEARLANLEKDLNASVQETEDLRVDIEELRYQISEREKLLEE